MANFGPLQGHPHSHNANHYNGHSIKLKGHWEHCNEVGPQSLAEHLVDLNQEPSNSNCTNLTHQATLSYKNNYRNIFLYKSLTL